MQEFDALYKTYYRQVYLYLLDLCKDPDVVEEHMAECINCRQIYDAMKTEGKTEELVNSEEFRKQQTDSVKKVKKKWSTSQKDFFGTGDYHCCRVLTPPWITRMKRK